MVEKIYLQSFIVEFKNPITNKEDQRVFVGRAIFTPDEIKKLKEEGKEEVEFLDTYFLQPEENAYEDPDNEKAQQILTDAIRASLDNIEKSKTNDKDNLP